MRASQAGGQTDRQTELLSVRPRPSGWARKRDLRALPNSLLESDLRRRKISARVQKD